MTTWNVENFFPPGSPSGPPDQATYDAKVAYLARTIRAVTPDVVAVQEVGSPDAAKDLATAIGDGWQVALSAHLDGRGTRVGALSPHPITV